MTRSLTIIASAGSAEIRTSILGWTERGLLHRSVWVDPRKLADVPSVMSLTVCSVGPDGVDEIPLRDVFGDTDYELVRVMAVRLLVDTVVDEELTAALWEFATRLQERVTERTRLLRLNVVIPAGNSVPVADALEPSCDANIVVSPEDRPSEGAVDHGLDQRGLFDGHSALACATIGALWLHAESSAFDERDDLHMGRLGGIVVARASSRVIDGRAVPDTVVRELLGEGVASLRKYRPASQTHTTSDERLVRAAYEAFAPIDDEALYYKEPPQRKRTPPRRILPMTLRTLVRFFWQVTGHKLLEWKQETRARLASSAVEWLHLVAEDTEPMTPERIDEIARSAPVELRPEAWLPMLPPTRPQLWPPLRQLCFGLVDRGPLPPEVRERWSSTTPEVTDPTWIAASPDERFRLTAAEEKLLIKHKLPTHGIRPGDRNAANRMQERFEKVSAKLASTEKPTSQTVEDQSVLRTVEKRFGDWKKQNRWDKSLIGLLAGHIDKQMSVAADALRKRRDEYDGQAAARLAVLNQLEQIRDRLWKHMWFLGGFLLGAVASVAALVTLGSVMVFAVVLCGLGSIVWFGVLCALAARTTALEQELEDLEYERECTVAAVERWPSEGQRLSALYEALLDWGEIIGWMLHRPFGAFDDADGFTTDDPQRPEAFKLGQADLLAEDRGVLAGVVAREVFGPGWLQHLYPQLLDAVIATRSTEAPPDEETDPDLSPAVPGAAQEFDDEFEPVNDDRVEKGDDGFRTDRVPAHARERLLRGFRDEGCGRAAREQLDADIRATMRTMSPDRLMTHVRLADRDPVSAAKFLSGIVPRPTSAGPCPQLASTIFSDKGRVGERTTVASVHLWGSIKQFSAGLLPIPERPDIIVHDQVEDESFSSHHYQFSMIRLDVSGGCEETDLVSNRSFDHGGQSLELADEGT